MRIFLTGVSGNLGRLLAERLAQSPETECITGIDIAEPKQPLPAKVQFIKLDIRSSHLAARAAGHDTIVHMAFLTYWRAEMPAEVRKDINVNGARNIARAALLNRTRRFVDLSSTAAYEFKPGSTGVTEDCPIGRGNSTYYCNDKANAERSVAEILGGSETQLTILRPCAFLGPRSHEVIKSVKDTASRMPRRDPRVQVVHEDDVADAVVRAVLQDMPGAYNVAPDDFLRMSELWKLARIKWVPVVPTRVMCAWLKAQWRYLRGPWHPSWAMAGAGLADYTVSNARLRATGWKPRFGSADAVRAAVR